MKILRYNLPQIYSCELFYSSCRQEVINCAINTRELSKDMVRVKSSNMWAYRLNVKDRKDRTGDLLIQFKGKDGGPGDIYIYYDVPVSLHKKLISSPSKGHAFWKYIRNNFKYSKLTGNKRGILPNAIN